jgi:hypothetical protein
MTPVWFVIEGNPVRQFYSDATALQHMDPQAAKHAILQRVGALRADAEGEDPNITLQLANTNGEASALLARRPPLGARARLMTPAGQVFSGIVAEIRMGRESAMITVES